MSVTPRTFRIQDKWNARKVWIFRHYKCGHYTCNQEIDGNLFYKSFQRVSKATLKDVLKIT